MTAAPRVELRPLREEDRDRLLAWRNSPEVAPYMYSDHRITAEEHARWFDGIAGDGRRAYWIIEMDGAPVGLANLYDIDRANRRSAWAYYLAEPQVRGCGVGSWVEYMMIERVFGDYGLEKLWCEVLAGNEAVWKLHQSFGFQIEARLRDHVLKAGEPQEVLGLGLLKADWAKVRDAQRARLAAKGYALPD
jgi:UDP-4-amino-4,6-dideoxy-N-acetyl-beta-L-altrosamine N-acetyltransferase